MHTNKTLIQNDLSVNAKIVNGEVYVKANNVSVRVSNYVYGFDFTETETEGEFVLWVIKASGLYRCNVTIRGLDISFTEAPFVMTARSVAAKLTTVGFFVAVLVGQQLRIYYSDTYKQLNWSEERKPDFDLEVDYSGQTLRVLYSKTASPEQVYVDEYTFSGVTLVNKLQVFDFKFGVTAS